MQIPPTLRAALESEAGRFRLAELAAAHARLSESYRNGIPLQRLSDAERVAYALARMPATYAAGRAVLEEVIRVAGSGDSAPAITTPAVPPPAAVTTMLDLGAGTGALAWAAAECIPQLDKMTLMESDARMIALGKTLAVAAPHAAIRDAEWVEADMAGGQFAPHDLVALSYSLGELPADAASRVLEQAWNAARWMLIIIEPGTPAGFARIRDWRTQLIASGGNMLAPCPHQRDCPIAGPMPETKIESKTETKTGPETGKDWCHFAQRVERTALHRRLKGGQLGHEDEKFSYIAFSKVPVTLPEARIIRHPHVAPGVIKLSLCAEDGLRGAVITKRDRAAFRRARHTYWGANWGEAWDEAGGAEIQTEPRPSRSGGSLGE